MIFFLKVATASILLFPTHPNTSAGVQGWLLSQCLRLLTFSNSARTLLAWGWEMAMTERGRESHHQTGTSEGRGH